MSFQNQHPRVAVVILNWNGSKYLDQFLPFVLKSSYPNMELIVADNASTDDSLELMDQKFPRIRVIRLKENHGFARGYNEALKEVQAHYYVLLNSDVEVHPGWLDPVIERMEQDPAIGAAQPKMLSYDQKDLFEYAGAAGGWLDWLGYPFARGRVFETCETDYGQYNQAKPVFWASGAALFIRSELFRQLKGFDEYFFAHMEEIDLCWRLQLAGYTVYSCPESEVYHVGAGTLKKENPQKTFLNFRNNLIMLAKNLPGSAAVWKIPVRILLDLLSGVKFLFSNGAIYFFEVLKAHLAFFYWLLFRRAESNFPESKKGKLKGWINRSIVWSYFVKGEKTFTEIVKHKD